MKLFYVILASLLLSFNTVLNGQYFGEVGTKWSYKAISNADPDTLMIIESIGEQMILGKNCSILQGSDFTTCQSSIDEINYVYYEDGIVFWYNEMINDFTILYDFNAEAGDSWNIQIEDCTIPVEIESVNFEFFNGEQLKVLYPEPSSIFGSSRIIERLGREDFLFPSKSSIDCGEACEGPQIVDGLRCYEDSMFNFQNVPYEELCFQIPPPTQDTCNFLMDLGADVLIDPGESADLFLALNLPISNVENIEWNPSGTLSCDDCYDPIASPIENTCYIVMVTNVFNCTLSDTICVFVETTAIDDLNQKESLKIFPNPVSDIISISSDKHVLSEIKIFDIHSRLIRTIPNQNLHLQNIQVAELDKGIYFIEVLLDGSFSRKKFIKR